MQIERNTCDCKACQQANKVAEEIEGLYKLISEREGKKQEDHIIRGMLCDMLFQIAGKMLCPLNVVQKAMIIDVSLESLSDNINKTPETSAGQVKH